MAYFITEDLARYQPINETSTVQLHDIGTIVNAFDGTTYGAGEFIYLKGVASTAIGNPVIWDSAGQTALAGLASRGPIAIAMSANVANQWGWYQIQGLAPVSSAANAVATGAPIYMQASAAIDDAVSATNKIDGCVSKSASGTPAATFTVCALSRPCMNGNG